MEEKFAKADCVSFNELSCLLTYGPEVIKCYTNMKKINMVKEFIAKSDRTFNIYLNSVYLNNFKQLFNNRHRIYVWHCDFSNFDGDINSVVELRVNRINDINVLMQLEKLSAACSNLTILPNSITSFANISELQLNRNKLSELPDSFMKLINLRYLDLEDNNFTNIPDVLQCLRNLEHLDISINPITNIPEFIFTMNLQKLQMHNTKLEIVPDIVGKILINCSYTPIERKTHKIFNRTDYECMVKYSNIVRKINHMTVYLAIVHNTPLKVLNEVAENIMYFESMLV